MHRLSHHLSFLAPAAVMSAWATVMLHTIASGHINRLLSPMFRGYVLTAAIALLLLSFFYVLLYQPGEQAAPALAPTGRLRQFGRWLVLLVPLFAAAVLAPDAFSSTTVSNRALLDSTTGVAAMPSWDAASQKSAQEALEADPNQPAPVEVTDLITLAKQPAQLKAFDGRKIQTVAQIMPSSDGAPKAVRFIMWCCAADAMPATVDLTGQVKGTFKDGAWYQLTGKARFPAAADGHVTAQIDVDSVAPAPEPDEPFLSP